MTKSITQKTLHAKYISHYNRTQEISINCIFNTSNLSNFEMQKSFEFAKLRILQHNYNRSTNVMQTILEYAVKNADIVSLQES